MTVANVHKDAENLTMTITCEFDAPVKEAWELWADPRKLERWWGPPSHPATVVDHDLAPDGKVTYYMTGPDGGRYHGWWRVRVVDAPNRLEFEDGFADDTGEPNLDMPITNMRVALEESSEGDTRMTIESTFSSTEAMEQLLEMGMEEGIQQALGQIDDILADATTS